MKIVGVDGNSLRLFASFKSDLRVGNHTARDVTIIICYGLEGAFLSLQVCKTLYIVGADFPRPMVATIASKIPSALNHSSCIWSEDDRENWIQSLPEDPSEEDFAQVDRKLKSIFKNAFDDTQLKPMRGPIVGDPMVITLKEEARPFAIHTARPVPFPQREKVENELKDMTQKKVITPEGDDPTVWCHPMVVVPKPNGDVRICVDLTKLNSEVQRSTHPIKTPLEAIAGFSPSDRFFVKLDLLKGYWQMALEEKSQKLTTFITPFGKFRFLRSPMGFVSTGDSYSYRGDVAMSGLNIHKVVDDMAAGCERYRDLVRLICLILERCVFYGLTVNARKSNVGGGRSIDFVGYKISHNSIAADEKKLIAIKNFPVPTNRTDLRSFIGLVNQLGHFSADIAGTAEPLRGLLKIKNEFLWLAEHERAFSKVKEALTSPPVLGMYRLNAPTVIQTDASKLNGLGFALLQLQGEQWRLIQCGSRFLQDAESRYAIIELEALAIFWAIKKCHVYLAGLPEFTVITDHKPLKPIFSQSLNAIENPRIQNYRCKLAGYNFTVDWRKGKDHEIPDALLRSPVSDPSDDDRFEVETTGQMAFIGLEMIDLTVESIRDQARLDPNYRLLWQSVRSGTISKSKTGYVALFKKVAHELSVDEDLVLRGHQLVIPPPCVKAVLKQLHASHQGIEKTKRRARATVFWPGYTSDIHNVVQSCPECAVYLPSHPPEPLIQEDQPTRPFEMATADLFSYGGHEYLVYSDRYSGFPLITKFHSSPTATSVITSLQRFFSLMGIPNVLRSDNGPQFSSSLTQTFLREWGVDWKPSSPHHSQSNGHAEAMVKSMKYLLAKTGGDFTSTEFDDGLLEFRNTPREDGISPAQRLFGRLLRSKLPVHWRACRPEFREILETADRKKLESDQLRKYYYDRSSDNLEELAIGDEVLVQDTKTKRWDKLATVLDTSGRRKYQLRFPSGRILWRNRRYIRQAPHGLQNENNPPLEPESKALRRSCREKRSPNYYTS